MVDQLAQHVQHRGALDHLEIVEEEREVGRGSGDAPDQLQDPAVGAASRAAGRHRLDRRSEVHEEAAEVLVGGIEVELRAVIDEAGEVECAGRIGLGAEVLPERISREAQLEDRLRLPLNRRDTQRGSGGGEHG